MTSLSNGLTYSMIGIELGRNVSTISRKVCFYQPVTDHYSAQVAHEDALYFRSTHGRRSKIDTNPNLLKFILKKLRYKWSPEQISNDLKGSTQLIKR